VTSAVALVTAIVVFLATRATPAIAAPGDPTVPGNEGGTPTLAQVLDETGRAYLEAQAALDVSKKRQVELNAQVARIDAELGKLLVDTSSIAVAAYRSGGLRTAAALLSSDSPDTFLDRATSLSMINTNNDRQLHKLHALQKERGDAKKAIDAEVANQQTQVNIMAKKKDDAEKALVLAGGKPTGGFVSATSPVAQPAPRNPDGSWPTEKCIIDDPTTTGCITARMLHAYQQARVAGFTRFTSCYRPNGPYEHPKGRACDFSATTNGFGGVAAGNDRLYGNNLAAFFVRNASALAVLYVIWFRQVWTPANGWHSYSGQCGDPSCDHTNHVHLSVI
jgi:peptidoglycan DL-endopeptidase CwlO